MIDETVDPTGQGPERAGFCQDCGKPLTVETARVVGSSTFCEPCLATRVGGAGVPPPPYGVPFSGATVPPNVGGAAGGPVYTEPFPPVGGSNPKPVLAALLGFIPGVGAMYNGQFAKGIAHIVIFALLQSMARMNDFFGFLVGGWVLYQVFEAYHTAKARRDGLPLPDPFGLNNIGVHVGAHFRGTPAGAPPSPGQPSGYPNTAYPGWTGYAGPQAVVTPPAPVEPVPNYAQAQPVWDVPVWEVPPVVGEAPVGGKGWQETAGVYPVSPVRLNRFPGAAVWLIGFGLLFLLLNVVPELRFNLTKVFPFVLMALGVGLLVRRMAATGGMAPTDGVLYRPRLVCSLRGPVILFTLGVLTALQAFDVIRFGRTWPVLVIVIGALMLLERSVGVGVVPVVESADASVDGKGI